MTLLRRLNELSLPDQKNLEEILRLAELGKMSGGILHDLANQMTTLTLSIGLAEDNLRRNGEKLLQFADHQKIARKNVEHLAETIKSHVKSIARVSFSAKKQVTKVVNCFSDKARANNINFEFDFYQDFFICGNPYAFCRIISNIIGNAIEALTEITDCRNRNIQIKFRELNNNFIATIADNGCGMPEKTLKQIFTTRFTTKKTGHGLGLITVKEMIREFKGKIEVKSQINIGTEFNLIFPKKRQKPESAYLLLSGEMKDFELVGSRKSCRNKNAV